jgi:hypothetical protein
LQKEKANAVQQEVYDRRSRSFVMKIQQKIMNFTVGLMEGGELCSREAGISEKARSKTLAQNGKNHISHLTNNLWLV